MDTSGRSEAQDAFLLGDRLDVSVGHGKGGLNWRRWIRRDPP